MTTYLQSLIQTRASLNPSSRLAKQLTKKITRIMVAEDDEFNGIAPATPRQRKRKCTAQEFMEAVGKR